MNIENTELFAIINEAGSILKERFLEHVQKLNANQQSVISTKKTDGTDLSIIDLEINSFLIDKIQALNTGYHIVSEESHSDKILYENFFLIDPLDGTTSFLNGENDFAILVAKFTNKRIVESYVFFPILNEFYYANGNTAFLYNVQIKTEKELKLSNTNKLKENSILQRKINFPSLSSFCSDLKVHSGIALKNLIQGNCDAVLIGTETIKNWDIAPFALIVEVLGGKISDIKGDDLDFLSYDMKSHCVVISNGLLHQELIQYLL